MAFFTLLSLSQPILNDYWLLDLLAHYKFASVVVVSDDYVEFVVCVVVSSYSSQAKPHPERRVLYYFNQIFSQELSEHDHNEENPELHNLQFDHEAFLGKELAAEFDKLTDKESKERLT